MRFITALALFLISCQTNNQNRKTEEYNVLFISVDDLRPELGCYGNEVIHSPNIDKLASEGFVFNQAFCQVPVCGASRASLLTGLLPTPVRFRGYDARMDEDAPEAVILPQHFKDNGYYTVNFGKVTHFPDDQKNCWSEEPVRLDWTKLSDGSWSTEGWRDYVTERNLEIAKNQPNNAGLPYEKAEVHDTAYVDGKNMKMAIEKLGELKQRNQPFFFALGILKPHLPFNAPAKYWDLYTDEDIQLASNPYPPDNVPEEGLMNFGELRAYADVPSKGLISDTLPRKLVHGYYACVSYADALIGGLIQEMEKLDLMKNTIIVLWGDHGWFLGEHGFWCKHALYELSARVPLIIKTPGNIDPVKINTIVELVDLFPTLCEMTNLPIPENLQGKSFKKAFSEPNYKHKDYSYTRFQQGESIKMDSMRYTTYFNEGDEIKAEMLYDHRIDPDENINVAVDSSYDDNIPPFREILRTLRKMNM